MPTNIGITAMSCQQIDGSENFTTYGIRSTQKLGNFSLGAEAGIYSSTTIDKKNNNTTTTNGVYTDIRGSVPYGETCFSGGFRVRSKDGTTQFRLQPANINFKVGDVNLYVTPYGVSNLNYETGKFSDPQLGFFGGASYKFKSGQSIFCEYQAYNACRINPGNSSINVGVSIPIK